MKLNNALTDSPAKDSPVFAEGVRTLLLLLAPFSPHLADDLWSTIHNSAGHSESIHTQSFPILDPTALVLDEITIVIQVLGKTRGTIQVSASATKAEIEQLALASEMAQRHIDGKTIKKTIVVPGKLVNFVV
jgi:leucyl-tRNA synthetase